MNSKHMHSSFFCFLAFFFCGSRSQNRQKKERVEGLFRVHFSFEKCNMSIYGAIVAFPRFGPVDSLVLTTSYQLTGSRRVWEWEQESEKVKKRQRRTMIYLWPQIALGVLCCDWSFNKLSFSLFSPKSDSFVRGVLCLLSFPSSVLSVLTHGPFKPTLNTNNKQDGNILCLGHACLLCLLCPPLCLLSLSHPLLKHWLNAKVLVRLRPSWLAFALPWHHQHTHSRCGAKNKHILVSYNTLKHNGERRGGRGAKEVGRQTTKLHGRRFVWTVLDFGYCP